LVTTDVPLPEIEIVVSGEEFFHFLLDAKYEFESLLNFEIGYNEILLYVAVDENPLIDIEIGKFVIISEIDADSYSFLIETNASSPVISVTIIGTSQLPEIYVSSYDQDLVIFALEYVFEFTINSMGVNFTIGIVDLDFLLAPAERLPVITDLMLIGTFASTPGMFIFTTAYNGNEDFLVLTVVRSMRTEIEITLEGDELFDVKLDLIFEYEGLLNFTIGITDFDVLLNVLFVEVPILQDLKFVLVSDITYETFGPQSATYKLELARTETLMKLAEADFALNMDVVVVSLELTDDTIIFLTFEPVLDINITGETADINIGFTDLVFRSDYTAVFINESTAVVNFLSVAGSGILVVLETDNSPAQFGFVFGYDSTFVNVALIYFDEIISRIVIEGYFDNPDGEFDWTAGFDRFAVLTPFTPTIDFAITLGVTNMLGAGVEETKLSFTYTTYVTEDLETLDGTENVVIAYAYSDERDASGFDRCLSLILSNALVLELKGSIEPTTMFSHYDFTAFVLGASGNLSFDWYNYYEFSQVEDEFSSNYTFGFADGSIFLNGEPIFEEAIAIFEYDLDSSPSQLIAITVGVDGENQQFEYGFGGTLLSLNFGIFTSASLLVDNSEVSDYFTFAFIITTQSGFFSLVLDAFEVFGIDTSFQIVIITGDTYVLDVQLEDFTNFYSLTYTPGNIIQFIPELFQVVVKDEVVLLFVDITNFNSFEDFVVGFVSTNGFYFAFGAASDIDEGIIHESFLEIGNQFISYVDETLIISTNTTNYLSGDQVLYSSNLEFDYSVSLFEVDVFEVTVKFVADIASFFEFNIGLEEFSVSVVSNPAILEDFFIFKGTLDGGIGATDGATRQVTVTYGLEAKLLSFIEGSVRSINEGLFTGDSESGLTNYTITTGLEIDVVKFVSPIFSVEDIYVLYEIEWSLKLADGSDFRTRTLDIRINDVTIVYALFNVHPPSSMPTGQPSVQPSGKPTALPSGQPSAMPSGQPSGQPTTQPSGQPSSMPSGQPTAQPSSKPSGQPSAQPSSKPSTQPTIQPSTRPSSQPTSVPSSQPSSAPSQQPSSVPTSAPTLAPTPAATPSGSLLIDYQSDLRRLNQQADVEGLYSELIEDGVYTDGAAALWPAFYVNTLPSYAGFFNAFFVTYIYQNESAADAGLTSSRFTCDNATLSRMINTNLQTADTDGRTVTCNDIDWTTKTCDDDILAFCVDCADPCASSCLDESTIFPPGLDCDESEDISVYRILNIDFAAITQPPAFTNLTTTCTTSTCTVAVELDKDGIVYCGVFDDGVVPVSSDDIINQFTNDITTSNQTSLTFTGLTALTNYDFYCLSEDFSGAVMQYQVAIGTGLVGGTTTCCRTMTASLTKVTVFEDQTLLDFLTLTLDSLPTQELMVTATSTFVNGSSGNITTILSPPTRTFTNTSSLLEGTFSMALSNTQNPGIQYISLTLSGPSDEEYDIVYPNGRLVTVLESTEDPPVPVYSVVKFSNDGTSLFVLFDSETNRAGITDTSFACSTLFDFEGVSDATCSWTDDLTVTATLSSLASIDIGGNVTVLAGNVRARCDISNVTRCGLYDTVPATSKNIQNADTPVSPSVQISMATTISVCSPLLLDLTSTTGSAGRDFRNISITVTGSGSVTNITEFFQNDYIFSPPNRAPAGTLPVGSYSFVVTMCNFLRQCSTSTRTITVVNDEVPTAFIVGSTYVEQFVFQEVSVLAEASLTACDGSVSTSGLSFVFSIFEVEETLTKLASVTNTAADPRAFKLAAYTLETATLYQIEVVVLVDETGASTTTSTQIFIKESTLSAVVSGGTTRAITIDDSLTLSGANSFDNDIPDEVGAAAGLSYEWICTQVVPDITDTCPFNITSDTTTAETITFYAMPETSGFEASVQMIITSGSRSATTSVTVYTVTEDAATVSITSEFASAINTVTKVEIDADITFVGDGTATWSFDSTDLVLGDIASSAISTSISADTESNLINRLTLPPGSLTAGETYIFTITVALDSGVESFSTVSLELNSGPTPGLFSVSPGSGIEVETTFTLTATGWTDDNLPLTFEYGFISASGTFQVIRPQSQTTFIETFLPRGDVLNNYTLATIIFIFDSFDANSTVTNNVRVFTPDQRRRLAGDEQESRALMEIEEKGEDKFNAQTTVVVSEETIEKIRDEVIAATTVSEYSEILAVGLEVMNTADCLTAPNCTLLNRQQCSSTDSTCGLCKDGFIGDLYDSNAPCTTVEIADSGVSTEGNTCTDVTDCTGFETCVSGVCTLEAKSCIVDCNNNGTCIFVNAFNAVPVSTCLNGDASCKAVCDCNPGREGAFCAYTTEEHDRYLEIRYILSIALTNLTGLQDITTLTTSSYAAYLEALTRIPDELSESALIEIYDLLSYTVIGCADNDIPYFNVEDILVAINSLADDAFENATGTSGRRLDHGEYYTYTIANEYMGLILENIGIGENAIIYTEGEFTIIAEYLVPMGDVVNASGFIDEYTARSGVIANQFSLPIDSDLQAAAIGVLSLRSKSYGRVTSELQTNVFGLTMLDDSDCPDSQCNFTITLENIVSTTYQTATTATPTRNGVCEFGVMENLTWACPSGLNATAFCNGTFEGFVSVVCPYYEEVPICGLADGDDVIATDFCTTVSYDDLTTRCACLPASTDYERPFTASGYDTIGSTTYAARIQEQERTPDAEFMLYAPTSMPTTRGGPDTERYMPVFVILTTFGIFILATALWFIHRCLYPLPMSKEEVLPVAGNYDAPVSPAKIKTEKPDIFVTITTAPAVEPGPVEVGGANTTSFPAFHGEEALPMED
jgi:hypothetical protein